MVCRICLQSDGDLITPCNCKGSQQHVHLKCLKKWIKKKYESNKNYKKCEICKKNYFIIFLNNTNNDYFKKVFGTLLIISLLLIINISTYFFFKSNTLYGFLTVIIIIVAILGIVVIKYEHERRYGNRYSGNNQNESQVSIESV